MNTRIPLSQIIESVSQGEREAYLAARYVRKKADAREQNAVLKALPRHHERCRTFFTGVTLARSWSDLLRPLPTATITSSQRALEWFVNVCEVYAPELTAHCALRTEVFRSMLNGAWMQAATALDNHQQLLGPTLWSLAWNIMLLQESRGSEARHEFVESVKDQTENAVIPIFAKLYGLSSDQSSPGEQFRKTIRACLPPSGEDRQTLEILLLEESSAPWTVAGQLSCAEALTLTDRYEFFLRLLALGLSDRHDDALRLRRAAARLYTFSGDEALKHMVEVDDDTTPVEPKTDDHLLFAAWDRYMVGDYTGSFRLAGEFIEHRPEISQGHELLVKSAMYLGKPDLLAGVNPVQLIWQNLLNVFSKNDNCEDSLSYLQRFGRRYRIPSLTHHFRALHAAHYSVPVNASVFRRACLLAGVHGPRNVDYGFTPEENEHYLWRCLQAFPQSLTFNFFHNVSANVATDTDFAEEVPLVRRHFFAGVAASRRKSSFDVAISHLTSFLAMQEEDSASPLSPFAIEEARRILVDIYRFKGDICSALRQVVRIFQDRPLSVRRLPIHKVYEAACLNEPEVCTLLEFPIIAYLALDDPHEASFGLRKFMAAVGIDQPSQLIGSEGYSPRTLATLFLRVCTPEVLDSLDSMNSLEKVEAERLQILAWIADNVVALARVAKSEQLRLSQHSQLRRVLQKIEGGRVVINIAALREAEQERFADAFVRFTAQRDLSANQAVSELQNVISVVRTGQVFIIDTAGILSQGVETFRAFIFAFKEVRKAFIYSPHFGIESCLSGRIRHGFVIQHIRKPFVERKLAVMRDSSEKAETEAYWRSRLAACDEEFRETMEIIFHMTDRVNAAAEEVRAVWLHSKTESTNPKGLFDYSFTDEQLEVIYHKRFEDLVSLEAFVDRALDILLERTRSSLKTVKSLIDVELRSKLANIVTEAISSLPEVNHLNLQPLRNVLAECYQEVERTCDQMMLWFQEADAALMGDAPLELVAYTAIGMIEQLNPSFRGRHDANVVQLTIRGRHFTALVHMLFFLLDNAIRHSGMARDYFSSKVTISSDEETVHLVVESRMPSPTEAASACRRIQATLSELKHSLDPSAVTKEGGSGLAKIVAALKFEFKQGAPRIDASYRENAIAVSIDLEKRSLIV